MSTQSTPRSQQAGFFAQMLRRKDSVMPTPSASPAPSIAPSIASLTQDNDNLAQENVRLRKRNKELIKQSELNQELFQETSEALMAKESETADLQGILNELKECIRRNDDASNETISTQGLQLEDLATQLQEAHEAAAKREALLTKLDTQQQQSSTKDDDEQQKCQQKSNDFIVVHWTKLHAKDKTIEFLRCRQSKSDKRIARLQERVIAAEKLNRDWFETIKLANSKVKAIEVKPQTGA
ncbi:uncharacterized protein ALTATR162_LOCUS4129 [Alternaria atra]|uniref:Uncharacterized protein n=1 Tax=Alternaria atra TaxID=119953 RepID=A0A8J2HXW4_9PLEO|nr:uncharacterized protein ALTATR162_LOCUS4129 [Alternaria atra]CAG5156331.1 unnamed protein product [Alternaria atra]